MILLNREDSVYFEETQKQALMALAAYPGGLQAGGGIHKLKMRPCIWMQALPMSL